jgi:RNase P/RNase MRP subunit POP5
VSTHRPRYRYIAFRLEGPRVFRRDEVLEALRSSSPRLWLVAFEGTSGLVRTTNLEKDAAIRFLNRMDRVSGEVVRLTTLGTSGTIRAATRKYGSTKRPRASSSEKEPL